jgi:hypothetical protein
VYIHFRLPACFSNRSGKCDALFHCWIFVYINPEAKMPSGGTIMEYAHKTGNQRLLQILSPETQIKGNPDSGKQEKYTGWEREAT